MAKKNESSHKFSFQQVGHLLKKHWVLVTLLLITFLLRVYRIEDLFFFSFDEEVPAFVGRRLILWHHLPLIGGVTPFGFHLAPYFYWILALLLGLGHLDPIIWGWAGAVISIATSLLMYLVGKELGGKKVGLMAATLWTFSFLANTYDRHFWALYWGPLTALLVIFSLIKIIQKKQRYIYLLAFVLAFSIHADLSNYLFLLLVGVVWIIYKLPLNRNTFLGIMIILLSFLPLIAFDLRHDFANTKPAVSLFQNTNKKVSPANVLVDNVLVFPKTFSRLLYNFGDNEISKYYSYCQNYALEKIQSVPWWSILVISILLLFFFTHIFVNKKEGEWRILSFLLLIYFIGLNVYGIILKGPIFEHYLSGLLPIFLLIFCYVLKSLPKPLLFGILLGFIALNVYRLVTSQNSFGLSYKKQAIQFTMNVVGDKPFSLDSLSTCWKYQGYRYLFAVYGKEPVKSFVDPNLAYLYGTTPVAGKHPQTVVSFVADDFVRESDNFYQRYDLYKQHEINHAKFGRIEVFILDNSSDWFNKLP